MAKVLCQVCGKEFGARRSDALYCPDCKPIINKEKSRRFEKRHREACPRCGDSMVRGATMCRTCNNEVQPWRKLGEENANWKGGVTAVNGYIYRRTERRHGGAGGPYKAEHRLIWEATHGPIPKGWVVHHLNGVKDDNRLENLAAMPRKAHSPRLIVEPYQKRIQELEKQLSSVC